MIAFDLICSNGHKFECWFKDNASFDHQKASGIINCPVCNNDQVEKTFSSFAIRKNGKKSQEKKEEKKEAEVDPVQTLRLIQEYVDKHFEDVGVDFAKEALKIHYGETQKRNIRGTASSEEETLLKKEGVQFIKIPIIKRLDN